jgi:putative intracellular protease/amidase
MWHRRCTTGRGCHGTSSYESNAADGGAQTRHALETELHTAEKAARLIFGRDLAQRRSTEITSEKGVRAVKILMVLTSHDKLGNTGRKTGFWLEEFASPYFVFRDAGVDLTLASPKGGLPPIDPKSDLPENQTPAMARFKRDESAKEALGNTRKLTDMKAEDYDTVFYVGGHGPMWDLVDNPDSIRLIESFYNSGKPVAAVCHSPAVFHRATYQGAPLVKGKRVTGFTDGEEEAVHLTEVVPFLVEDELKSVGGLYEKAADWQSFAIVDGRLITGQNPASSTAAANSLLKVLAQQQASD